MSKLFQPLQINPNLNLKNRIVIPPMCQYSAEDGFANDWHLVHLGARVIGGAAAIIQEATAVSPEGRISYGDLGIWKDEHIEKLKNITAFLKLHDCIPGIQLAHAGRKASTEIPWIGRQQIAPNEKNGWQTYSSSAVPFESNENPPLAMSIKDIEKVIKDFKSAAKRSVEAGYEIIEIHAAHGYLIHQFLSPLINQRQDEYGGSFDNRIRFLMEILNAVKSEVSTQSIWVRISATDWAENGWNLDEAVELCKILKENGVDVMDISSGGAVAHQKIEEGKNYQVPFAKTIKEKTGILTGTVGLIFEAQQAEAILQNEEADFVLIGRESLRDAEFPLNAAKILGVDLAWPNQYARAKNNHYQ